jgi:hypothetical protein
VGGRGVDRERRTFKQCNISRIDRVNKVGHNTRAGGEHMSVISQELRSVGYAAEQLHVSPGTVRNWIAKGYLRAVVLPSGHKRLPDSEINRMVARMFELPSQLDEESVEPAPRRQRGEMSPDEWGPAV